MFSGIQNPEPFQGHADSKMVPDFCSIFSLRVSLFSIDEVSRFHRCTTLAIDCIAVADEYNNKKEATDQGDL